MPNPQNNPTQNQPSFDQLRTEGAALALGSLVKTLVDIAANPNSCDYNKAILPCLKSFLGTLGTYKKP